MAKARFEQKTGRGWWGWLHRPRQEDGATPGTDPDPPGNWDEFLESRRDHERRRRYEETQQRLPPRKVRIASPMHSNLVYLAIISTVLAVGYSTPEQAPLLIYAAIGIVSAYALLLTLRDALFFHLEAMRLEADAEMVHQHPRGLEAIELLMEGDSAPEDSPKSHQRKVFRSKLFQIHFQNILRAFEQGNRRTRVDQEASITDIHTMLSQKGMKLVWTMVEILPLLGLLGTLIGLVRMFLAFDPSIESPEVTLLTGFGTALGTTVLANVFVLVLRPLHMRNERAMYEILNSMQIVMATFILPTQQQVLDRREHSPLDLALSGQGEHASWEQHNVPQMLDSIRMFVGRLTTQLAPENGPGPIQAADSLLRELQQSTQVMMQHLATMRNAPSKHDVEHLARAVRRLSEQVAPHAENSPRQPPPSERAYRSRSSSAATPWPTQDATEAEGNGSSRRAILSSSSPTSPSALHNTAVASPSQEATTSSTRGSFFRWRRPRGTDPKAEATPREEELLATQYAGQQERRG